MRNLATASFQTEFIKDPLTITVTPEAILHKEGSGARYFVSIDIYDGGVLMGPDSISALSDGLSSGTLADGITWQYSSDTDGRVCYMIKITADASLASTLLVPFNFAYDGKQYTGSFSITTVKDGGDGGPGPVGPGGARGPYIPPAMLWKDYPTNPVYYFESADPTTDPPETKLDVVLVENGDGSLTPYECIQSHFKDSGKEPGTAGGINYWRAFTTNRFKAIATDLLLADKARIEFLSGQAIRVGDNKGIWGYFGAPYNEHEIIFTGHSNDYEKKIEEGQTVEYTPAYSTFSLNKNGYALWGEKSGKRIEVNPDEVAVRIYDKDGNLCTTLSGEWKDLANAKPGGADTDISGGTSIDRSSYSSATHLDAVIPPNDSSKAATDGSALIKIPQIYMQATCGADEPFGSESGPVMMPHTSVRITITIYTGTDKATISNNTPKYQRSYSVSAGTPASQSSIANTESQTITRRDISVPIKKGEYIKVVVKTEAEVIRNVDGNWSVKTQETGVGTDDYKSKYFSGKFVYKGYMCRLYANGLFISYDSNNYCFFALDANKQFKVMCVADGIKLFGNMTS